MTTDQSQPCLITPTLEAIWLRVDIPAAERLQPHVAECPQCLAEIDRLLATYGDREEPHGFGYVLECVWIGMKVRLWGMLFGAAWASDRTINHLLDKSRGKDR